MIDPTSQHELIKLRIRDAQRNAGRRALIRQARRPSGMRRLGAIGRFWSLPGPVSHPENGAALAEACVDAESCVAC